MILIPADVERWRKTGCVILLTETQSIDTKMRGEIIAQRCALTKYQDFDPSFLYESRRQYKKFSRWWMKKLWIQIIACNLFLSSYGRKVCNASLPKPHLQPHTQAETVELWFVRVILLSLCRETIYSFKIFYIGSPLMLPKWYYFMTRRFI